jgi:class 3 adenylate cyclase
MPETRYARNGNVSIAYQVFGEGPVTLVVAPPGATNCEVFWEDPHFRRMAAGFASFCRLVHFDKRGTGLSDRAIEVGSFDERVDDMKAVLDDAGVEQSYVMGSSEGGPMAIVFAATYPERTLGLVLAATTACFAADDHQRDPGWDEWSKAWPERWGTADTVTLERLAPSLADDDAYRRWWAHYERQSMSPGAWPRSLAFNAEIDVRHLLTGIHVQTLVLHRRDDLLIPVAAARYLADHIEGSRLVELDGPDHMLQVGSDTWMDEIREFTTGTRRRSEPDRLLATVLFTDIVASTEQATTLGDRRWAELLDVHDRTSIAVVAAHGGTLVRTTGDGILAWFDGPARAIRCASELLAELQRLGLSCRAGMHAGEIERRGDDIGGIGVHIAARVEAKAAPGELLASRTVKDLVVGSLIRFEDRGTHQLKGVDDDWQLYAVTDAGSTRP